MLIGSTEVEIRRNARKRTIAINIERDGSVNAIVPNDCPDDMVYQLLMEHEYTICKRVATITALNKDKAVRPFENGQSFMFLGKGYNLEIRDDARTLLSIKDDKFIMSAKALPKARETFIKYYKRHAIDYIQERINFFSEQIGRKPNNIKVMELGSHWASCTPQGNINFHWKCIMAKPSALDYLIVHEMTHLRYPNHSPRFWDAIISILPDYKEQEDWLTRNGVFMDL